MGEIDQDAVVAAADLVGRAGAREFECGYLDGDPARPDWYATATLKGAKIIVEDYPGPVEACEALARRILEGGRCAHCGGLVALSDNGAVAFGEAVMADGTTWTAEQAAAAGQCRWRRMGDRWVRGCETTHPTPTGPNRAERRRKKNR